MDYEVINGRVITGLELKERRSAEQYYKRIERAEGIRRTAKPFIEAGQPFEKYAERYNVGESDRAIYDEAKAEHEKQKQLGEAFLRAFQGDTMPTQQQGKARIAFD